ncbi:MAG: type I DNA topoisomerase [Fimbriimonadales bacterium]
MPSKNSHKTLVIVESPTKARTIERFLGDEYEVVASNGHVRDLPAKNTEVDKEHRHKVVGVDVEKNFEPVYVVPDRKRRNVDALKSASKTADAILLATDEDREGESIGWHVLQLIKPKKATPVGRIVFHEITKEAVQAALLSPRKVDEDLVRAQEARRILDRLFGYTLSPLVGLKIRQGLSAGRVQSVAVRLIVMRERERKAFRAAVFWDLKATVGAADGKFDIELYSVDGRPTADGNSFNSVGELTDQKRLWLKETDAAALVERLQSHEPWTVTKVDTSPGTMKAPTPFTTASLQIEANRKLNFSSAKTMSIAQRLFEGKDIGSEQVGLITYHRTDSLALAESAISEARLVIESQYGKEYLPDKPKVYKSTAKGAQEAHEAIRPTSTRRLPATIERYLDQDERRLYDLIWKRTMACQMNDARIERTQVEVTADGCAFRASGKRILFAGFLRAYVEGADDPAAELGDKEKILPALKVGEIVNLLGLGHVEHATKPPARYTEASLVKKLEDEGIGRPSTYSSIINTIVERGYVRSESKALVPTFDAFAATQLLEDRFADLVDLKFTAHMEQELDDVAAGKEKWTDVLKEFYFGQGTDGIGIRVEAAMKEAPYPTVDIGDGIVVRFGRKGAFLSKGDEDDRQTADVPDNVAPADLTVERAEQLLQERAEWTPDEGRDLGTDASGNKLTLLTGRFGPYIKVQAAKPRNVSLPKDIDTNEIDEALAKQFAELPRTIGKDITGAIGPYGPYIKQGSEYRNLPSWRELLSIDEATALALLSVPKETKKTAGRDLGDGIKVMAGRFGPYVSDGTVNATLPKSMDAETIDLATAIALIEKKKAAGPSTRKRTFRNRKGS